MKREEMTTEQIAAMRELALSEGKRLARKVFAKRGNHSEAHLSEMDLMALLTVAFDLGVQAAVPTGGEE